MVKISGTRIVMTRGDTLQAEVEIFDRGGEPYVPAAGDTIRFALKEKTKHGCGRVLLRKSISIDTLLLQLDPEDTEPLPYGEYGYDIEITMANGVVDTFIPEGTLELKWEAD